MDREDFEKLVEEALEDLPEEFAKKMENVEIVVEDGPPPYINLFGLYVGIPKLKRGSGYTFVLPDKITIFQKSIEAFYKTPQQIKEQVRKTVLHEVGHHFGLSDATLRKTKVG